MIRATCNDCEGNFGDAEVLHLRSCRIRRGRRIRLKNRLVGVDKFGRFILIKIHVGDCQQ